MWPMLNRNPNVVRLRGHLGLALALPVTTDLLRLQPCVEVVKSSSGWHRAKRSGIQDQISLISLALTISEEKLSAFTASCTFRLGGRKAKGRKQKTEAMRKLVEVKGQTLHWAYGERKDEKFKSQRKRLNQ